MSETPRTDKAMSRKPDEIEGTICDRCGNGVGPFGCCATIDWAVSVISKLYPCSQELERELSTAQAKLAALTDELFTARKARQLWEAECLQWKARVAALTAPN